MEVGKTSSMCCIGAERGTELPDSRCTQGPLPWQPLQPYAVTCEDARTSEQVGALCTCLSLVGEVHLGTTVLYYENAFLATVWTLS